MSAALTNDEMKKLLRLCNKYVHLKLNKEIYVLNYWVAMGSTLGLYDSLLGPLLANVFILKLENTLVPRSHEHSCKSDNFAFAPGHWVTFY